MSIFWNIPSLSAPTSSLGFESIFEIILYQVDVFVGTVFRSQAFPRGLGMGMEDLVLVLVLSSRTSEGEKQVFFLISSPERTVLVGPMSVGRRPGKEHSCQPDCVSA